MDDDEALLEAAAAEVGAASATVASAADAAVSVVAAPAAGKVESEEQPPPGLSAAALRAWKRRRKLANAGANRIDLLTGSRDLTAQASAKEFEAEKDDIDDGKLPAAAAAAEVQEKLPKWEAKWAKAASQVEHVDLGVIEQPLELDAEGNAVPKKPQLRQRTGAAADETKEAASAGADANANAASEEAEAGAEGEAVPSAGMKALRENLRRDRWGLREFWLRQLLIVLCALAAAAYVHGSGALRAPDDDLSSLSPSGDADTEDAFFSDNGEVEVDWGNDAAADGDGDVAPYRVIGSDGSDAADVMPTPLAGFASVPVVALAVRVALHLATAVLAGVPFSLTWTTKFPRTASKADQGSSLMAKAAAFVPQLAKVSNAATLARCVADDAMLAVVLFVLATSVAFAFA